MNESYNYNTYYRTASKSQSITNLMHLIGTASRIIAIVIHLMISGEQLMELAA